MVFKYSLVSGRWGDELGVTEGMVLMAKFVVILSGMFSTQKIIFIHSFIYLTSMDLQSCFNYSCQANII